MTISVGDKLPNATLLKIGEGGPEAVQIADLVAGKKVVIFGLPGAYTSTCTSAHVPSFMRTADALKEKGVAEIICFSVNDPFVMQSWGNDTGASAAGIHMLADASAEFTKALGLNFSADVVGFFDRAQRHAMIVNDGVIEVLNIDSDPGTCNLSAGEAILDAL
ncbi:MAG: peroxiredoxin [Pseudomonadota bacterium]